MKKPTWITPAELPDILPVSIGLGGAPKTILSSICTGVVSHTIIFEGENTFAVLILGPNTD